MVDPLAPDDVAEGLSAEELRPGTRLGRYELLLAIAKGGMARVWAARQHGQRGFSKTVAIKTILPHLAEEPEFERMFLDEARIAALIHHPNVCEIYELGEEGRVLYLAMEWVNGESLVHILRSSGKMAPMEPRLSARIVADACAGVHAAHVQTDDAGRPLNVVHRDVSPHNILVSADGNVKVADFGVAKALGQMQSATVAGQVKGKIAYMAPEQIGGASPDRRVDVFAMGVVLYEATTGRRPFTGDGDAQVMHAILQGQFAPPSRVIRGYPPELEQIVVTAMAPDQAQRFPTAERMRTALEEYLARSGPVVTQTQVGAFVQQRVGNVLDRRRDRIRAAANAPNPDDISGGGQVGGTPSAPARVVSGVRPAIPVPYVEPVLEPVRADATGPSLVRPDMLAPAPAGGGSKYALAVALGVLVAAAAGVGAILYTRSKEVVAPVARPSTPSTLATPAASAAPTVTEVVVGAQLPAAFPSIELRGLPQGALLHVDGHALGAGVRAVPRPHGPLEVHVTATGFAEEVVKLDESSPPSMDVAMTLETTPVITPPANRPPPRTTTSGVALPANPY